MKANLLWSILIIIILCIVILVNTFHLYEFFESKPQVWYFWKSGDNASESYFPYWNDLIKRVEQNNLDIKICDVNIDKEPDLEIYEKSKQEYDTIPFVRIISSNGNRYDYNVANDYKYYISNRNYYNPGDITSNKIYRMIVENKDK